MSRHRSLQTLRSPDNLIAVVLHHAVNLAMGPFLHGPQDPLDGNSRFYWDACSGFAVQIPIPMLSYLTFSWIFAANLTCTNATNVLDFRSLCSHRKVRAFSPTASNLSIHHPTRIWPFPRLQSHLFSSFESRRVSGFSLVTSHGVSIKSDMISGDLDLPTLFPVILSY